jgi:hypothetical protein
MILWDGRSHVDINLFTYTENIRANNKFLVAFKKELPELKTVLRDEQPRGFGRVVTYMSEIEEMKGKLPVWAKKLLQEESEIVANE